MSKKIVYIGLGLFALLVLIVTFNIKDAFWALPIKTNETLEVPPFADWRKFVSPSDRFTVSLPAVPQYAQDSVPLPGKNKMRKYEMYISEKLDGAIFMISLITYPDDMDVKRGDEVLHQVINEMMETKPDNKLTNISKSTFLKHPTFDFDIKNKDFFVKGKAFLVNSTVYLLTYIASSSTFTIKDYDHFMDSFEIGRETY